MFIIVALSFPSLRQAENPRDYTGTVVIHTFVFLSVMYSRKVAPNEERQDSQRSVVVFVVL